MSTEWFGPILTATATALLAAGTYLGFRRATDRRRAKRLALTIVGAGCLLVSFQVITVLGIEPSEFKTFSFVFLVLLPLIGSAFEWRWLIRMAAARSDAGPTVTDLGRAPGWTAVYGPLLGAFAYVSGQIPHVLKDGRTLFHVIPMIVLAASSVIAAVVAWKTHTRVTRNGIWTGRGFFQWSDVEEWFFKIVGDHEVMFLTTSSGFLKEQVMVNVSESQKEALTAVLKQRLPHLEKRHALASST